MKLKRLELSGFKSFAKKTSLFFDAPITAVVGPNGSGKSNVSEAFRWVLGEQSMKTLRGKRGEDLIFNGGASAGRLNHASVFITFDNTSRALPLDFSEVTIGREVFRDGANEYYVNGSKVRLKDIYELLANVSLGSTGHHIISQGEADRILSSNIFERKAMVEESLGLKIYHWKIAESEKKLEKTEDNIKQVESLRRELAPHIKFLKKQVEKIERADEMRRELKSLYAEYLKKEAVYLAEGRKGLQSLEAGPKEELAKVEAELQTVEKELSVVFQGNTVMEKMRSAETRLRDLRREKDEVARALGRLEGMIEVRREMLNRQEEIISRPIDFAVAEETLLSIDRLAGEAESGEPSAIKEILNKIRTSISEFIKRHKDTGEADKKHDQQVELDKLLAEKEEQEKNGEEINIAEKKATEEVLMLKAEIEGEREKTIGREREAFELKAKRSELRSQLDSLRSRREKLELEETDFKRELGEAVVLVNREILNYESFVLTDYNPVEERVSQEEKRRQIEKIKIRLEDMGVEGVDVMEEYKETTSRDEHLERELGDLISGAESLRQVMNELREKLATEFTTGLLKINKEFQNFFALMFGGGTAGLELIVPKKKKRSSELAELKADEDGELNMEMPPEEDEAGKEGIDVNVSLPKKKIKGLQMLSGGERALTSIALLFAMSQVNPPPFLILDETDAALDEANSRRYGDMIVNLSKYSQLILITHNRETMARAGIIYGVTMGADAASRLLSIRFEDAAEYAK